MEEIAFNDVESATTAEDLQARSVQESLQML